MNKLWVFCLCPFTVIHHFRPSPTPTMRVPPASMKYGQHWNGGQNLPCFSGTGSLSFYSAVAINVLSFTGGTVREISHSCVKTPGPLLSPGYHNALQWVSGHLSPISSSCWPHRARFPFHRGNGNKAQMCASWRKPPMGTSSFLQRLIPPLARIERIQGVFFISVSWRRELGARHWFVF